MKQSRWQLASVIAGLIASLHAGMAAEATSETFVGSAVQIAGNNGVGSRLTTFAMRSLRPVSYAGAITALESSALIDSTSTWTNNQFNAQNGSYFVEFDSGLVADINATDATGKRLVFPGALPNTITVGSKYRIRKHLTIEEVFGANNEAGLVGGRNSTESDNVVLFIPQNQQLVRYYYRNITGFSGWYTGPTASGDTVIFPEQGIMVDRKTNTTRELYWAGAAKPNSMTVPVFPGFNLVGTLRSRSPVRLADLNLITGDSATGLAGGMNSTEADNLLVINSDATTRTYYYRNITGFSGWRSGSIAADDVLIAPGTAFYLFRKSPRSLFYWTIPSE